MRTMVVTMIVLLCAGVGFAEPNEVSRDFVLTVIGGPSIDNEKTEIGVWAGLRKGNTEFGGASMWRIFTENDTKDDVDSKERNSEVALGVYASVYLPEIIDVDNPLPFEWLPDKILSEPYFGGSILADLKGKGAVISPHTGILVYETVGIMYQFMAFTGNEAKDKGLLTLSAKFPF